MSVGQVPLKDANFAQQLNGLAHLIFRHALDDNASGYNVDEDFTPRVLVDQSPATYTRGSNPMAQQMEITHPLVSAAIEYSVDREQTGEMMGVVINLVGQTGEGEVDLVLCLPKQCRNLITVLEECEEVLSRGNSLPPRPPSSMSHPLLIV